MLLPALAYLVLVTFATLWSVTAIVAVARVRRRRSISGIEGATLPPVSVLKPLCGIDNNLENNLRTFFEQDYPAFELVFGVEGSGDPAIAVVRRLRDAYPSVPCRIVIHDGGRGLNPKVGNLRAMLGSVRHDVLVISDSNIAVVPGYLREMALALGEPGVGVVSNLFAGVGERGIGATLENLYLNATVSAGAAVPTELLGHPVVIGKSMMFRRSVFERLGGFESVASVLAEDYVIGRMFHEAGFAVRLCATPVHNVVRQVSVRDFVDRRLRWGMIRFRVQPLAFLVEPLTVPLFVAVLAPLFGVHGAGPVVWAVALTVLRDATLWTAMRGPRGLAFALPLFPLCQLLVVAAWIATFFRRHVTWRGRRVRVSAGTRLYAEQEPDEPRMLMVES